jgi:sigma-B regulation protein RsbU (phosphoserine phosphatase)
MASHSQTSTETGGDWLTIIDSPQHQTTTAVIADVTGHGAAAALVTAIIHGFFNAMRRPLAELSDERWRPTIEALLRQLNHTLIESTRRSLACSIFIFTFNHRTLRARYVNAGHVPPMLVRTVDGVPHADAVASPPSSLIGDVEEPNLSWGELELAPDQLFLLYTDGLVECSNGTKEKFGYKRLRKLLVSIATLDARTARDRLMQETAGFFGEAPREDDVTFIVGKVR